MYSSNYACKRRTVWSFRTKILWWSNAYTLKDIKGEFDAKWFDDENESTVAQNKPVNFSKAVVYKNISSFIGSRLNLMKLVKGKDQMIITEPIISIEHVYGCVYKIEDEDAVYITYVVERTVG